MQMLRFVSILTTVLLCIQIPVGAAEKSGGSLNIENTTLYGVRISDKEDELIKKIGNPLSTERGEFLPPKYLPTKALRYEGYDAFFVNGVMYAFECVSAQCKTNLNLYVGDSLSKVEDIYGTGERKKNSEGNDVIIYKFDDINVSLVFLFDGDRVSRIRLFRNVR